MSNLKVNAKTPILEFKRKHNLLVESEEEKANVLTVSNIQSLTNEEINSLKCGDIVAKEDSTGKHSYVVTFKKDNVGICLSYFDGSGYLETVSYDYTEGNWVYNSTDVCNVSEELAKKPTIYKVNDLANVPNEILNKLKLGDYVYDSDTCFLCNFNDGASLELVYNNNSFRSVDSSKFEYEKVTEDTWVFLGQTTASAPQFYKHYLECSNGDVITIINHDDLQITNIGDVNITDCINAVFYNDAFSEKGLILYIGLNALYYFSEDGRQAVEIEYSSLGNFTDYVDVI